MQQGFDACRLQAGPAVTSADGSPSRLFSISGVQHQWVRGSDSPAEPSGLVSLTLCGILWCCNDCCLVPCCRPSAWAMETASVGCHSTSSEGQEQQQQAQHNQLHVVCDSGAAIAALASVSRVLGATGVVVAGQAAAAVGVLAGSLLGLCTGSRPLMQLFRRHRRAVCLRHVHERTVESSGGGVVILVVGGRVRRRQVGAACGGHGAPACKHYQQTFPSFP